MRIYSNTAVETRLTAAIDAASVSVSVGDVTGWPVPAGDEAVVALSYGGTVEIATYTGIDGTTLTGLTRGLDGTVARAHASGAAVAHVASAADVQRGAASQEYTDAETVDRIAADDILAAALVERLTETQADALYRRLGVLITEADVDFEVGGGLSLLPPLGLWFSTPCGSVSTVGILTDTVQASPLPITGAITLDRIGCSVTTAGAAGSIIRLALYSSDASGAPDALLLEAGVVASDTVGDKELVINQPVGPGVLWLAAKAEVGTCTVRSSNGGTLLGVGGESLAAVTATNTRMAIRSGAVPAGSMPALFGAPQATDRPIRVAVRRAA